jgi:tRNA U34 5-carboxymethylaminomethyl modifying enzyme MnmG/GidA
MGAEEGIERETGIGAKEEGARESDEKAKVERNPSLTLREATTRDRLLARPEITYNHLRAWGFGNEALDSEPRVVEQVEIRIKYAGYIARQSQQVERNRGLETRPFRMLDLCVRSAQEPRILATVAPPLWAKLRASRVSTLPTLRRFLST